MHRQKDAEPRGRFGLPPEQPVRRGVLSPLRAFTILATAGLVGWLFLAGVSTDSSRDASFDSVTASRPTEASPSSAGADKPPPTEAEALAAFRSLDRLRATVTDAGAGRVLTPDPSFHRLQRTVPPGGRTRHLEVLSLEEDRIRIRQVIEFSTWDIDLTASDLSVARAAHRLGVEWSLTRVARGWRISGWQLVEDRVVVGSP